MSAIFYIFLVFIPWIVFGIALITIGIIFLNLKKNNAKMFGIFLGILLSEMYMVGSLSKMLGNSFGVKSEFSSYSIFSYITDILLFSGLEDIMGPIWYTIFATILIILYGIGFGILINKGSVATFFSKNKIAIFIVMMIGGFLLGVQPLVK